MLERVSERQSKTQLQVVQLGCKSGNRNIDANLKWSYYTVYGVTEGISKPRNVSQS